MSTCRNPIAFPAHTILEEIHSLPETYPIHTLTPYVEWMRYCESCDRETRFIADRVYISGLIGACTSCGEERIAPFTRGNSEAA